MLDPVRTRLIADQVVILIVPGKRPGRDLINHTVPAGDKFFLHVPLTVEKTNLPVLRHRFMDQINAEKGCLVHGLRPVDNEDLPSQFSCIFPARELLQLSYELLRFGLCDKFRGLYRIDQELQLGKGKLPLRDIIPLPFPFDLLDFDPECPEAFEVSVNGLAVAVQRIP